MITKTIRIPVVIDANGRWAAGGSASLEKLSGAELDRAADWGFLCDCCDNEEDASVSYTRMWVTVEVPLPETVELDGVAEVAT